jgi:hypothetical protein
MKHEATKSGGIGREGVQRLLRTNPEFAEAFRKVMEYRGEPEPEVLIKVTGPTAAKAKANPAEVFVGVRDPNGPTTFERNPNHVVVLVDRAIAQGVRTVDGRAIYPTVGVAHVYDPLDALKG